MAQSLFVGRSERLLRMNAQILYLKPKRLNRINQKRTTCTYYNTRRIETKEMLVKTEQFGANLLIEYVSLHFELRIVRSLVVVAILSN